MSTDVPLAYIFAILPNLCLTEKYNMLIKCRKMIFTKYVGTVLFLNEEHTDFLVFSRPFVNSNHCVRVILQLLWHKSVMIYSAFCKSVFTLKGTVNYRKAPIKLVQCSIRLQGLTDVQKHRMTYRVIPFGTAPHHQFDQFWAWNIRPASNAVKQFLKI